MKIDQNVKPILLTNFEVYKGVKEWQNSTFVKNANENFKQKQEDNMKLKYEYDLKNLMKTTVEYLENTEAVIASSFDNIKQVAKLCDKYGFTKSETVQVLNNRPKSYIELFLIIEDLDDRISEDDREKLILEIQKIMPIAGLDD